MKLVPARETDILELMSWFPDQRSCFVWGGPGFRYPFTEATFREDMRQNDMSSHSLVGDDGKLLGFGQYYLRSGRCHLARLVISPNHRGRGLGAIIIREISRLGCGELRVSHCSLFVLADNAPAIRLYSRLGFVPAPFPEGAPPLEGGVYMFVAVEEMAV